MTTIMLGEVAITPIIERDGPWRTPWQLFPAIERPTMLDRLARLEPFHYDPASERLVLTFQSFLVRTPRHVILIDSCVGDHKQRKRDYDYPKKPWLDGFLATGLAFEAVDFVFCTHMHVDHVGWNTRLVDGRWVPTFPNARYVFARTEYEYWRAQAAIAPDPSGPIFEDSVLPIVEADRAVLVEADYAIDDTVWLTPSHGHTPGHVSVNIESRGQRAVFTGDIMHHAVQCLEPGWSSCFCADPVQSATTRRATLEACAAEGSLVVPAHFPAPTAGRIVPEGDGFRFRYLAR
ncbi:MAG: MBL fold metallo-hydrolase [Alphaproteobacteria bacterium]|nr:MBL fold metallo-hydrolase [Alphaproteobacteria bacterium]